MTKSRADKEVVILSQVHQAAVSPGFNVCVSVLLVCIVAVAKEDSLTLLSGRREVCLKSIHQLQKSHCSLGVSLKCPAWLPKMFGTWCRPLCLFTLCLNADFNSVSLEIFSWYNFFVPVCCSWENVIHKSVSFHAAVGDVQSIQCFDLQLTYLLHWLVFHAAHFLTKQLHMRCATTSSLVRNKHWIMVILPPKPKSTTVKILL